MNRLFHRMLSLAALSACCVASLSCMEDDDLVQQRDEQRAELRRLEGELMVLEERLSNPPKDRTNELQELEAQIERDKMEIATLEQEIPALQSQKRELEAQLKDYQRNYPLR